MSGNTQNKIGIISAHRAPALAVAALALAACLHHAGAAVLTASINAEYNGGSSTASGDRGRSLVGLAGFGTAPLNVVQSFQLPTLDPGVQFGSVTYSVPVSDFSFGSNQGIQVDLYALPPGSTAAPSFADGYYIGSTPDTTNATLIASNFITPAATSVGGVVTLTDSSAALLDYLNAAYAGGSGAGSYVYLRLSPQSLPSSDGGYDIYSNNTGGRSEGGADTSAVPTLTYTTALVPEPAVAGLPIVACGLLATRRRRT
jgi:hypothetical protein